MRAIAVSRARRTPGRPTSSHETLYTELPSQRGTDEEELLDGAGMPEAELEEQLEVATVEWLTREDDEQPEPDAPQQLRGLTREADEQPEPEGDQSEEPGTTAEVAVRKVKTRGCNSSASCAETPQA